jgi:hypothetical protein
VWMSATAATAFPERLATRLQTPRNQLIKQSINLYRSIHRSIHQSIDHKSINQSIDRPNKLTNQPTNPIDIATALAQKRPTHLDLLLLGLLVGLLGGVGGLDLGPLRAGQAGGHVLVGADLGRVLAGGGQGGGAGSWCVGVWCGCECVDRDLGVPFSSFPSCYLLLSFLIRTLGRGHDEGGGAHEAGHGEESTDLHGCRDVFGFRVFDVIVVWW